MNAWKEDLENLGATGGYFFSSNEYIDTFAGFTGETVPLLMEAARIRPGNQVLEIGSGPGHVADLLDQAGASVTGVGHDRTQQAKGQFGTIISWMGSTYFLTKTLDRVSTEMSLHVLAYNMKRMMNILGTKPLIEAIGA